MTYTVVLDFFIEEDGMMNDAEVQSIVEEIFDGYNCSASNIRVLEVND